MLSLQCLLYSIHDVSKQSACSNVSRHAFLMSQCQGNKQAYQLRTFKLKRRGAAPVNYANSAIACHYKQLPVCTPAASANLALDRRGGVENRGEPSPAGSLILVLLVQEVYCFAASGSHRQMAVGRAPCQRGDPCKASVGIQRVLGQRLS